ncbi:MAG: hypothetical protein J2P28_06990 [Actinobacteria bacterium]|nr:hypothetical protein [Actinomycetota bacterium]
MQVQGDSPRLEWRQVVVGAVAIWCTTRLGLIALTYFTGIMNAHGAVLTGQGFVATVSSPEKLLQSWVRWDATWYLRISSRGYADPHLAGYFPLYPVLVGVLAWLFGDGAGPVWPAFDALRTILSLVVSNLASLFAIASVGLLTTNEVAGRRSDAPPATHAMLALVAFPFAFFLAAGYSDGLFLGLAAMALLFARRGRWAWACGMAVLAGTCRPTAAALVLPLGYEFGRQLGWWGGGIAWREGLGRLRWREAAGAICVLGAAPVGVGLFAIATTASIGDPLAYLHAQRQFLFHTFEPPWTTALLVLSHLHRTQAWSYWQALTLLDLTLATITFVVAITHARRLPLMLTLYVFGVLALSAAVPIEGLPDVLTGIGRYQLACAPLFVGLALVAERRPNLWPGLVGASFMLQAVLATFWLSGGYLE